VPCPLGTLCGGGPLPGFNVDEIRRFRGPWRFTARGRTWDALPIPTATWCGVLPELQDSRPARHRLAAMRRLFRAAFPWRLSMLWHGDPVREVLATTPRELSALFESLYSFHYAVPQPALNPFVSTRDGGPVT